MEGARFWPKTKEKESNLLRWFKLGIPSPDVLPDSARNECWKEETGQEPDPENKRKTKAALTKESPAGMGTQLGPSQGLNFSSSVTAETSHRTLSCFEFLIPSTVLVSEIEQSSSGTNMISAVSEKLVGMQIIGLHDCRNSGQGSGMSL